MRTFDNVDPPKTSNLLLRSRSKLDQMMNRTLSEMKESSPCRYECHSVVKAVKIKDY